MLQKESLGHFVRQVPSAARAPFKAFAAWNVRLDAYLRRPEVEQARVSLPHLPACCVHIALRTRLPCAASLFAEDALGHCLSCWQRINRQIDIKQESLSMCY